MTHTDDDGESICCVRFVLEGMACEARSARHGNLCSLKLDVDDPDENGRY